MDLPIQQSETRALEENKSEGVLPACGKEPPGNGPM